MVFSDTKTKAENYGDVQIEVIVVVVVILVVFYSAVYDTFRDLLARERELNIPAGFSGIRDELNALHPLEHLLVAPTLFPTNEKSH